MSRAMNVAYMPGPLAMSNERRQLKQVASGRQLGIFHTKPKRSLFNRAYGTAGENRKALRRRLSYQPKKEGPITKEDYENKMRAYGANILGREMKKQEATIKMKKPLNVLDANRLAKIFTPKDEKNKTLLLEKLRDVRKKVVADTNLGERERENIARGIDMHRAYLLRKQKANEQAQERYEEFFHWLLGTEHLPKETYQRLVSRGLCVHGNRDAEEIRDYLTIWINAYYMFQEEVCRLAINGPGQTMLDHVKYWHLFVENEVPEDAYTNTFLQTLDENFFLVGKKKKEKVTIAGAGGSVLPTAGLVKNKEYKRPSFWAELVFSEEENDTDDEDDDQPPAGGGVGTTEEQGQGQQRGGGVGAGGGAVSVWNVGGQPSSSGTNNNDQNRQNQSLNNLDQLAEEFGQSGDGQPLGDVPRTKLTSKPPANIIDDYVSARTAEHYNLSAPMQVQVKVMQEEPPRVGDLISVAGTNINAGRGEQLMEEMRDLFGNAPVPRTSSQVQIYKTRLAEIEFDYERKRAEMAESYQQNIAAVRKESKESEEAMRSKAMERIGQLETELKTQTNLNAGNQQQLQQANQHIERLQNELTNARSTGAGDADAIKSLNEQLAEQQGLVNKLQTALNEGNATTRDINKKIQELQAERDAERRRADFTSHFLTSLSDYMKGSQHIDDKISGLNGFVRGLINEDDPIMQDQVFRGKLMGLAEGFHKINEAAKNHQNQIMANTAEIAQHKREISDHMRKNTQLSEEITKRSESMSALETARDQAKAQIETLRAQITAGELKRQALATEGADAKREAERLRREVEDRKKELEGEIEKKKSRIRQLKAEREAERQFSATETEAKLQAERGKAEQLQKQLTAERGTHTQEIAKLRQEALTYKTTMEGDIAELRRQAKAYKEEKEAEIKQLETSGEEQAKKQIEDIRTVAGEMEKSYQRQITEKETTLESERTKREEDIKRLQTQAQSAFDVQARTIADYEKRTEDYETQLKAYKENLALGGQAFQKREQELTQAKSSIEGLKLEVERLNNELTGARQALAQKPKVVYEEKIVEKEVPSEPEKIYVQPDYTTYISKIDELEGQKNMAFADVSSLKQQLETKAGEVKAREEQIETMKTAHETELLERSRKASDAYSTAKQGYARMEARATTAETALTELRGQLSSKETEYSSLAETSKQRQKDIEELRRSKEEMEENIRLAKDQILTYQGQLEDHKKTILAHKEEIKALKDDHEKNVRELLSASNLTTEAKETLAIDLGAAQDKLQKAQEANTQLENEKQQLLSAKENLYHSFQSTEKQRDELQKKVNNLETLQQGAARDLSDTERAINEKRARYAAVLKDVSEYQKSLETHAKQAHKGVNLKPFITKKEMVVSRINTLRRDLKKDITQLEETTKDAAGKVSTNLLRQTHQDMVTNLGILKDSTVRLVTELKMLHRLEQRLQEPRTQFTNTKKARSDSANELRMLDSFKEQINAFAAKHNIDPVDVSSGVTTERGLTTAFNNVQEASHRAGAVGMINSIEMISAKLKGLSQDASLGQLNNVVRDAVKSIELTLPHGGRNPSDPVVAAHATATQQLLEKNVLDLMQNTGRIYQAAYMKDKVNEETTKMVQNYKDDMRNLRENNRALQARQDRFVADTIQEALFDQMRDVVRIGNQLERARSYTGGELENLSTEMKDAQMEVGSYLASLDAGSATDADYTRAAHHVLDFYRTTLQKFPRAKLAIADHELKLLEKDIKDIEGSTNVSLTTYTNAFQRITGMLQARASLVRKTHENAARQQQLYKKAVEEKLEEAQNQIAEPAIKAHEFMEAKYENIMKKINDMPNLKAEKVAKLLAEIYRQNADIYQVHNRIFNGQDFDKHTDQFLNDILSNNDKFAFAKQKYEMFYKLARNMVSGEEGSGNKLSYAERNFLDQQVNVLQMEYAMAARRTKDMLDKAIKTFDDQSPGKRFEAQVNAALSTNNNNISVSDLRTIQQEGEVRDTASQDLSLFKLNELSKVANDPTAIDVYIAKYYETASAISEIQLAEEDMDFLTMDQFKGIHYFKQADRRIHQLQYTPEPGMAANVDAIKMQLAQLEHAVRMNNGYYSADILANEINAIFVENGASFDEMRNMQDASLESYKLGVQREKFITMDITAPVQDLEENTREALHDAMEDEEVAKAVEKEIKQNAKNRQNDIEVEVMNNILDDAMLLSAQEDAVLRVGGETIMSPETMQDQLAKNSKFIYSKVLSDLKNNQFREQLTLRGGNANAGFFMAAATYLVKHFNSAMKGATGHSMEDVPVELIGLTQDLGRIFTKYSMSPISVNGSKKINRVIDGYTKMLYDRHPFIKRNPYFQYMAKAALDMGIEIAKEQQKISMARVNYDAQHWEERMLSPDVTNNVVTFNETGSKLYYGAQPDDSYIDFVQVIKGNFEAVPGIEDDSKLRGYVNRMNTEIPKEMNAAIRANIMNLVSANSVGQVTDFYNQIYDSFSKIPGNYIEKLNHLKTALSIYHETFKHMLLARKQRGTDNRSIMKMRAIGTALNVLQVHIIQHIDKASGGKIKPAKKTMKQLSARQKLAMGLTPLEKGEKMITGETGQGKRMREEAEREIISVTKEELQAIKKGKAEGKKGQKRKTPKEPAGYKFRPPGAQPVHIQRTVAT